MSKSSQEYTILITKMPWHDRQISVTAVFDAQRNPIDLHVEDASHPSMIGEIHIARVQKVVPSLHAAFCDIAGGQTVFLPLDEDEAPIYVNKHSSREGLHEGDEIAVQIIRDAIRSKDACASCAITFHGDDVLLITGAGHHGVSRKLNTDRRSSLRKLIGEIPSDQYHITLRTSTANLTDDEIREQIRELNCRREDFLERVRYCRLFDVIRPVNQATRDLILRIPADSIRAIRTDDDSFIDQWERDSSASSRMKAYQEKIASYRDDYELYKLFNLTHLMKTVTQKTVWLPSGGSIVIEQTEAMNVIDVNTAKMPRKGSRAQMFLACNLEACEEIARQMRLRNLSGMILIDFINLSGDEAMNQVLDHLRKCTADDSCRVTVVDVTGLGIVEVTRQKRFPSVAQELA